MLTIGSLFSGIGGLELGLEWAGLGPVVWQVEKDPFCRLVLERHYPEANRFDDVCTVGAAQLVPVDLICGGFPCQDVSGAGLGAGLTGERSGLWREFARIIAELHPRWVVVENVTSGAGRWLDAVVRELEQLGYACLPVPLAASDVGAPHRRARIFIVAHVNGGGELQPEGRVGEQRGRLADGAIADADCGAAGQRGRGEAGPEAPLPTESRASGAAPDSDSELSNQRGMPGRDAAALAEPRDHGEDVSDAHSPRRQGAGADAYTSGRRPSASSRWAFEPGVVPLVHGLSGGLAGRRRRARIRSLGNSVVPQCAEVVGWVIRELAGLTEATP